MRGDRLRYGVAILAMTAGVATAYTAPWICQTMLDGILSGKPISLPSFIQPYVETLGGIAALRRNLWAGSALIVLLTAISGLFVFLKGRFTALAAENTSRRLRDQLYERLQRAPNSFHDKMETGDLVQRCTSDVEIVRVFLATQVVEIIHAALLVVTVLPIMLWFDVRMSLVALCIVPPIVVFGVIFFVKIKSAFLLSDQAEGKMSATLQENLTGIRVVRAFARQEFECQKFGERNSDYRDKVFNLIKLLAWYWSLSDLMCLAQKGVVLFAGVYWITQGQLTPGVLFAFMVYVNMFLWPVRNMGRVLTDTGKTLVALKRLQEILAQASEPSLISPLAPLGRGAGGEGRATPNASTPPLTPNPSPQRGEGNRVLCAPEVRGDIAFKDVCFGFAADKPVLRHVSFDISAGQTLAILGPAGAGKSVLIQLLLRLYERGSGTISIDGRDVREMELSELRRSVGAVMQEPFLFSKSLRENLKLGRSQALDEEMFEATHAACIHEGIVKFEKGYDTLVGERGVTLSGGQRQRVAIARAILKDPAILVLDDALSAVDTRTESLILEALKSRRGRHTTIVIAHRLSTLMHADKIIVLDKGKIIQTGTHASLLLEDGLYSRLWRIQASLEEDLSKEMVSTAS